MADDMYWEGIDAARQAYSPRLRAALPATVQILILIRLALRVRKTRVNA